jgi:hypothetical protein
VAEGAVNGIIIGGEVLPGTERVMRDEGAWWAEPSSDIYPRQGHRIDRVTGHWTGGHAFTGPEAGRKLVENMKRRRRETDGDGRLTSADALMDVSVHFGIAWDGGIFQLADLSSCTIHASRRINLRSCGVECMWPGTVTMAERLGMPAATPVVGYARGGAVKCYPPSPELLEAWRWLVDALCTAQHPLLTIPRQRGGEHRAGVLEHCDVKVGDKVDAGGLLIGALGWR